MIRLVAGWIWMNNVVTLKPVKPVKSDLDPTKFWNRDVIIWKCDCGGEQFFMLHTGEVECVNCAEISVSMICGLKDES